MNQDIAYIWCIKSNKMTTSINRLGEEYTKWQSHKHPENENFMQVVFWHVWVKADRTTIIWNLGSNSQNNYVYGMSKEEAISKFTDQPVPELTEVDFQKWLEGKA